MIHVPPNHPCSIQENSCDHADQPPTLLPAHFAGETTTSSGTGFFMSIPERVVFRKSARPCRGKIRMRLCSTLDLGRVNI